MGSDGAPSFADQLRRHRLTAGFTQEHLAERAGISLRGLDDLERGIHIFPLRDTVAQLAKALALAGDNRAMLIAAGRWERRALRAIESVASPETVRAVIAQRIARPTPRTQDVLYQAGILGQTFTYVAIRPNRQPVQTRQRLPQLSRDQLRATAQAGIQTAMRCKGDRSSETGRVPMTSCLRMSTYSSSWSVR